MIVSHKHKYIFIKPYKTAGTSVELALSAHCGEKDIITPFIFDPDPNVRENFGASGPANYVQKVPFVKWRPGDFVRLIQTGKAPEIRFSEHQTARGIRLLLGDEVWNAYRKISIVRNPWDHAVSFYNWVSYRKQFDGTFEEYIKVKYSSYWPFLSIDDQYCIDFIIRFEQLNDDVRECLTTLGLPSETEMPRAKTTIRKDRDYREYYTDETREMVRQKNAPIIERFGYIFE